MNIIEVLSNKRILLWGYGREGKSTELFLKRYCRDSVVEVYEGNIEGIDESKYDLIIKSPGIPMENYNPKYTSQTELFLQQFRNNVIGVTGTKGKSTTSTMLYEVLSACSGRKVLLVGNIGKPCLDCYEEVTEDTIVVFELSCHQLANIKISPHIAVLLNIYEEHLDYYKTFKRYRDAKLNITTYQDSSDYLFVGEETQGVTSKAKSQMIEFPKENKYELNLLGLQNQYNAEFVYTIATTVFQCDESMVLSALREVKGLPHRLEKVCTIERVTYYDDSIATIPEATIHAIESIPNVQTIIIGGMDRGIDYSKLIECIREHSEYRFILCYQTGDRIFKALQGVPNCMYVQNLESATKLAMMVTEKDRACLLSPAAPSYGYFKNFEERGEKFKEYLFLSIRQTT